MANTLAATFRASLSGNYVNTLTSGENVSLPFNKVISLILTNGTTTNKADVFWSSLGRTLTGTTPEDIDVFDLDTIDIGTGAGESGLGNSITFADIVLLIVTNNSSSTGNLTIGNKNSTAAWQTPFGASDTASVGPIPPGGFFILGAGADPAFLVTNTDDHLLTMTPTANLTYDIYLLGRSA